MISYSASGNTKRTDAFLATILKGQQFKGLPALAEQGVAALRAATPRDSGLTADSWSYEIETKSGSTTIWWLNSNQNGGFNVAIGLQYGHGTGNGGWIAGYDFINPALRPIFDKIADSVWKEVQRA